MSDTPNNEDVEDTTPSPSLSNAESLKDSGTDPADEVQSLDAISTSQVVYPFELPEISKLPGSGTDPADEVQSPDAISTFQVVYPVELPEISGLPDSATDATDEVPSPDATSSNREPINNEPTDGHADAGVEAEAPSEPEQSEEEDYYEPDEDMGEEEEEDPCGRTDAEIKWDKELQATFAAAMPAIIAWNLYRVFKANKKRVEEECKMTPKERQRMKLHEHPDTKTVLIRSKVKELLDNQQTLKYMHEKAMDAARERECVLKEKIRLLEEQGSRDRKRMKNLAKKIDRKEKLRMEKMC